MMSEKAAKENQQMIQIPAEKLIDALFNIRQPQPEQHYATQESVDGFKEQMKIKFEQVDRRFEQVDKNFEQVDRRFEQVDKNFVQIDKRFEQVEKRFDNLGKKIDRLQWFIVASALTVIFKDYLLRIAEM